MEAQIHMNPAFNFSNDQGPKQTISWKMCVFWVSIFTSSELTYYIKNPSNGPISTTGQDSEVWNISKEI